MAMNAEEYKEPKCNPANIGRTAFGLSALASLTIAVPLLTGCDRTGKDVVPGDEVRVQVGGMLHSIDEHWRGEILDVETEPIMVDERMLEWSFTNIYSRQDNWPERYSFSDQAPAGNSYPWLKVVIPADSRLYGQTLRATIKFKVTWPVGASGEVPIVAIGPVKDASKVITENIEIMVAALKDQAEDKTTKTKFVRERDGTNTTTKAGDDTTSNKASYVEAIERYFNAYMKADPDALLDSLDPDGPMYPSSSAIQQLRSTAKGNAVHGEATVKDASILSESSKKAVVKVSLFMRVDIYGDGNFREETSLTTCELRLSNGKWRLYNAETN